MSVPALELTGISKRYGTLWANREASLSVNVGELHAVVGENGAGKSTLLQVAAGLVEPDAGVIYLFGTPFRRLTPARAIDYGVGLVQQHFSLIPPLTVAENVVLGREPGGLEVNRKQAADEVRALSARFGLRLDPLARVESLSVGEKQQVEILKVLYRKARLLMLDEPTAVLAPLEVTALFEVLKRLVAEGHTVIFVTHRLREVLSLADRVTVMRRGEVVARREVAGEGVESLAAMMVGDPAVASLAVEPVRRQEVVAQGAAVRLKVEGLTVAGAQGRTAVEGVDLEVRAGEILGVAGVLGNGQSELLEAIAGMLPSRGRILLDGQPLEGLDAGGRLAAGLAHIPEDRQTTGLVAEMSVTENLVLGALEPFSRPLFLNRGAMARHAEDLMARHDIRPPQAQAPVSTLSGGNQQKVVVARELARPLKVLLAAQPTRGVDLAASQAIHGALERAREAGVGILLVSADLAELLALSDRVAVMYRGKLVAVLPRAEASEARVGALMLGR